jgi:hypothetical protein
MTCPNLRQFPEIFLDQTSKIRDRPMSLRISGLLAVIWNRDLPNIKQGGNKPTETFDYSCYT